MRKTAMSLDQVIELINRLKLVEVLAHSQGTPNQGLVETVTHRQNLAELRVLLERLSPAEIATILSRLALEDAGLIWPLVEAERGDDILWELESAIGEQIAPGRIPKFHQGQVTLCAPYGDRLRVLEIHDRAGMEAVTPIWIDMLGLTSSERGWIARRYGVDLPQPDDLTDLEVSTRFYVEDNGELHLHSNFLLDRDGDSRSVPVALIIHDNILFSVRNVDLPVFRLQRYRLRQQNAAATDARAVLLALYGADVEYSADLLEGSYAALRRIGKDVLSEHVTDSDAARLLAAIAKEEALNGRVRINLLDTQRAVSFLLRGRHILDEDIIADARDTLRDIESLANHSSFLFDKINFLMDATVGFININQNRRVSQLTVAGVVFMPINVAAGVGGMSEFSMMTQGIPWPLAYAGFIVGMILIGWLTYMTLKLGERRQRSKILAAERRRLSTRDPDPFPHRS